MECLHKEEAAALNHYKNTEYFDKSKFINASMSKSTLDVILSDIGIIGADYPVVLDFGCGTGETLAHIAVKNDNGIYVGVDYSKERIDMAKKNCYHVNHIVTLVNQDVNTFVESISVNYDFILAFEIIEHLVDADHIVKQLKRMLAPGGTMIITLPYQAKPNNIHLSAFKDITDVRERLGVEPYNKNLAMRFPEQNIFIYKKD